jgi:thiol-disulfide isomerase/thioredoxin
MDRSSRAMALLAAASITFASSVEGATQFYPHGTTPRPLPVTKIWNATAKDVAWNTLKGRVVILDFWSYGCPPCLAALPGLIKFRNRNLKNVEVIGFHVGGREVDANAAVGRYKLPYPVVFSPGWTGLWTWGGSHGLPMVVVIDKKGVVRYGGLLPAEAEEKALELVKE